MDKLNLNVTKGLKYVVTTFFAQFGNSVHGNRITGIPRSSGNLPGHLSQGPLTTFEGKDTPFHNKTLIGNVSYRVLPGDKVVVNIPYYASPNGTPIVKLTALGAAISKWLGKETGNKQSLKVEVRLLGLRYPYLDRSILAQYVAINGGKYNFTRMHKLIFNKLSTVKKNSVLPSDALSGHITGLKLELAGRLTTQRSIPRKTVSNKHTGSFYVNKNRGSSVDFSQYASKNKIGAYTIKVWLSNVTK